MADYTLATNKAKSVGSSGGLQADLISPGGGANVAAASIASGAGQIRYTPSNIPQAVENQTSKGIQHFLGVTAEAAFNYQERESTFFADALVSAFTEKANALLHGTTDEKGNFVGGYSSKTKRDAVDGYGDFSDQLQTLHDDALLSAEPRVQQKALFKIASAKNAARNKATTHRNTELGVAQEEQKFQERLDVARLINLYPGIMTTPDPLTGASLKDRYLNTFSDKAKGMESWFDTLVDIGKQRYIAGSKPGPDGIPNVAAGLASADEFLQQVAGPELLYSPKHLRQYEASLQQWGQEAQNTEYRIREYQFKLKKRADEIKHNANNNQFRIDRLTMGPKPPGFYFEEAAKGNLNPVQANNLEKLDSGRLDETTDPDLLADTIGQLRLYLLRGGVDEEGKDMTKFWNSVPGINRDGDIVLQKVWDARNSENFERDFSEASDVINARVISKSAYSFGDATGLEKEVNRYYSEYRYSDNLGHYEALSKALKIIPNPIVKDWENIPLILKGGVPRPSKVEDFDTLLLSLGTLANSTGPDAINREEYFKRRIQYNGARMALIEEIELQAIIDKRNN